MKIATLKRMGLLILVEILGNTIVGRILAMEKNEMISGTKHEILSQLLSTEFQMILDRMIADRFNEFMKTAHPEAKSTVIVLKQGMEQSNVGNPPLTQKAFAI